MRYLFAVLLMFFLFPICGFSEDTVVPVRRTGQSTSYRTGDDGALQEGVVWPSFRFTDNRDGTVRDNLTRLVWMRNAGCWAGLPWANALSTVAGLNAGTVSCSGYTTGTHTDWRLPQIRELSSLIDAGHVSMALPSGHPFSNILLGYYWSATTYASNTGNAWLMSLIDGNVSDDRKTNYYYVWPVRGGQ
ncbi:MAG: DUF1566 domain-containing protein [Magnetococcales bacterium]|nr:DUF1566 domain-containing protein [Magnetococcales bacterium]